VSTGNRYNDDNIFGGAHFVVALLAAMSNNAPRIENGQSGCLLVVRKTPWIRKARGIGSVDSAAGQVS